MFCSHNTIHFSCKEDIFILEIFSNFYQLTFYFSMDTFSKKTKKDGSKHLTKICFIILTSQQSIVFTTVLKTGSFTSLHHVFIFGTQLII